MLSRSSQLSRSAEKKRRNLSSLSSVHDNALQTTTQSKSSTTPSKKKLKKAESSSNIFRHLVSKAGFVLNDGTQPNELECDQAVFQKELKKLLKNHEIFSPEVLLKKFMTDLEHHLDNKDYLKWGLLYTQTVPNCSSARSVEQDSLVRLLLNIDEIQPPLIKILVENLLVVAYTEESQDYIEVCRLVLFNLRWLDHIVDCTWLTTKIIDMLKAAPTQIQKEIIQVVPDIILDQNHPEVANVLCKLYTSTEELVPSILDALPYLTLESGSLSVIHHSVMKTLNKTDLANLPLVLKFLLHNTEEDMAYIMMCDIRENIRIVSDPKVSSPSKSSKRSTLSQKDSQIIDYKLLIFSNIEKALNVKKYGTKWLKAIDEVNDVTKITAFDILILFQIHSAVPARRKTIESIFRNKIRKGLPNILLDETFKHHTTIIKKYFNSVKSLASALIRSSGLSVSQCGAFIYRCAFYYLDGYFQQEIILNLLSHLGDNQSVKSTVLTLLSSLSNNYTEVMAKYANFIKGSIDMIELFQLSDAKILMECITLLAYSTNQNSGLRDELSILIRKQLSHNDMKYKRLGVVSAVQSMKYMIMNKTETHEISDVSAELNECNDLFELVLKATSNSNIATALFMDELASTILKEDGDQSLEELINEKVADKFIKCFIMDYDEDCPPPSTVNGIPMSWQYNLDGSTVDIFLNLGPMAYDIEKQRLEQEDSQHVLFTLCPQFGLMRMIETRLNDGNLKNIDALMGCPIYFPTEEVIDRFSSLPKLQQHTILSCLFYLINWFRELINAFSTQKEPELKKKVYERLRTLVGLQKKLGRLLPLCPDYCPHLADFHITFDVTNPISALVKKSKKPRSKASNSKSKTYASQIGSQNQDIFSQPKKKEVTAEVDFNLYKPFFREFHLDIINLLFKKLETDVHAEAINMITLAELEFLLDDFNGKLSHSFSGFVISPLASVKRNIGFTKLDLFLPNDIADLTYYALKSICAHLENIHELYQSLLEDSDGILDASNLYREELVPVSRSYLALFTTMATMLSWQGLQLESNQETLKNMLSVIAKRIVGKDVVQMELGTLIRTSFEYLCKFIDSILNIKTALVLSQAIESLVNLDNNMIAKEELFNLLEKILKNNWYTLEGKEDYGSLFNKRINKLLQMYIRYSSYQLDKLHNITFGSLKEFVDLPPKSQSKREFQTLNKTSLPVYYSTILENLAPAIKAGLSSAREDSDKLAVWTMAIEIYDVLVNILSKYDTRTFFLPCLNYSRGIIELYLNKAMPVFDNMLLQEHQQVLALLRCFQRTTRLIQHLCNHTKVKEDQPMMRHVPAVKKALELLVYRVKVMLVKNDCQDAFWMGNLKNRDLQGNEITTQVENEASTEGEEDTSARESEVESSVTNDNEEQESEEEEEQSDVELDEVEDKSANSEFSREI